LIFSGRATDPDAILLSFYAFVAFCFAASATYAINDVQDRDQDRFHPTKKNRPIPRGAISIHQAIAVAIILLIGAGGLCLLLPRGFAVVLGNYVVINLIYTYWLKRRVIVDVIIIAIGFVLRAVAGGVAIGMGTSPWLVVCTFTLCMFLGFGKRQCEIVVIGDAAEAARHRKALAGYTSDLLNHLTSVTAGIAIVTFLLYAMDRSGHQPFDKQYLIVTLPLVIYAIFRYAMLIRSGRVTGPTDIVLNDRPFVMTLVLWAGAALVVVYWGADLRGWLRL
jgi:4-hydroxybenzoate polyprenyltransferase